MIGLSGCSSVVSREHLYIWWSNYFPKRLFQFTSLWVLSTQIPMCVLGCRGGCWEFLKGALSGTYFGARAMGSNCLSWEPQPCLQLAWWSWASYAVCPDILTSKGILTSGWCKSSVKHVCEVLSFSLVKKVFLGLWKTVWQYVIKSLWNRQTEKNHCCQFDRCKSSQFDLCLRPIQAGIQ